MSAQSQTLSYDTKTIIVVLLLVFVYPVGIILMWIWKLWPLWVRILLTCLLILPILFGFLVLAFIAGVLGFVFSNPDIQKEMQKNISVEISQTPNDSNIDTSTWKTYEDTYLKITFKYPPNWHITSLNGSDNIISLQNYPPSIPGRGGFAKDQYKITLAPAAIFSNGQRLPIYARNITELQVKIKDVKEIGKNSIINGNQAYIYENEVLPEIKNPVTYILDGKGNVIEVTNMNPTEEAQIFYNRLINTITFTQ